MYVTRKRGNLGSLGWGFHISVPHFSLNPLKEIRNVASAAVQTEKSARSAAAGAIKHAAGEVGQVAEHAAGVAYSKFDKMTGGNAMLIINGVATAMTMGVYAGISATAMAAWKKRQAQKIADAQNQQVQIDQATQSQLQQLDAQAEAMRAERARIQAGGAPDPSFTLPDGSTLGDSYMYVSKEKPQQLQGLGFDWGGVFGTGMQVFQTTQATKQAASAAQAAAAESQARVAEAQANVKAQELALQAEALRSKSKSVLTNPLFIGGAILLLGGGAYMVLRKRRGRR